MSFKLFRKSLKYYFVLPYLLIQIFFFSSNIVKANYSSLSLSPSSGTITSSNEAIAVVVDSGTDEFVGLTTELSFSGDIEYVSSTGASRCDTFQITEETGSIEIECISITHDPGQTYDGTIATLYFKATGDGSSTFSFSNVDPSAGSVGTGSYTLDIEDSSNDSNDTLPQSGIFDNFYSIVTLGFIAITLGITIFIVKPDFFRKKFGTVVICDD